MVKPEEDAKNGKAGSRKLTKVQQAQSRVTLKNIIDYQSITYQEPLVIYKYESNLPLCKHILMIFKPL
jgi:hypothetical protein